jgi:hypothetical protein
MVKDISCWQRLRRISNDWCGSSASQQPLPWQLPPSWGDKKNSVAVILAPKGRSNLRVFQHGLSASLRRLFAYLRVNE